MTTEANESYPLPNSPEMTVSEISASVKKIIEAAHKHVRVRGEIGRVSCPSSGHIYLDLKDAHSVLACVIWRGQAKGLNIRPEEGLEVVVSGYLTTFAGQSKYQIIIENMALAGLGELMVLLEKRKAKLSEEGLFDAGRKQKIPFLPQHIGVITSPSGAVIRDILHRLRARFPRPVTIWPVAVQGQSCAGDVAHAIEGFNAFSPRSKTFPRPDILIVARGGGSVEDLWGFNEESVVRAVAASTIPVISAIGHETDTTLIDFVADLRAPTPTAAAELCVPVRMELINQLTALSTRLHNSFHLRHQNRRERLKAFARNLPSPARALVNASQRLDLCTPRLGGALRALTQAKRIKMEQHGAFLHPKFLAAEYMKGREKMRTLSRQLNQLMAGRAENARTRLAQLARLHATLGYRSTLKRGYAVIHAGTEERGGESALVTQAEGAKRHKNLDIEFFDGRVEVEITQGTKRASPVKKRPPKEVPPKKTPQGKLF